VKKALEDLLEAVKESKDLDMLSENAARIIVDAVSGVLGSKSDTHKKPKFLPTDVCRTKGLITTICKARDLIRTLVKREYDSVHEEGETKRHLEVLFDRMIRMGLYSVPRSLTLERPEFRRDLDEWSEVTAAKEIQLLENYLKSRKEDMASLERESTRRLFMDPKKKENMVSKRLWVPEHRLSELCDRFLWTKDIPTGRGEGHLSQGGNCPSQKETRNA